MQSETFEVCVNGHDNFHAENRPDGARVCMKCRNMYHERGRINGRSANSAPPPPSSGATTERRITVTENDANNGREVRAPKTQNEHLWCIVNMKELIHAERSTAFTLHALCYVNGGEREAAKEIPLAQDRCLSREDSGYRYQAGRAWLVRSNGQPEGRPEQLRTRNPRDPLRMRTQTPGGERLTFCAKLKSLRHETPGHDFDQ